MAKLLMHLRGVSEEEANEVRDLLTRNHIDYYETPPNRWGLTMGAIWLRDEEQHGAARSLLDDYQQERQQRVRAEYEALRQQGRAETVVSRLLRDPLRSILYLAIVAGILYFLTIPFFTFGGGS